MFNLKLVALDTVGRYGCCSLRGREARDADANQGTGSSTGLGFSVHDAQGHRVEPGDALLPALTQAELDALPWR